MRAPRGALLGLVGIVALTALGAVVGSVLYVAEVANRWCDRLTEE